MKRNKLLRNVVFAIALVAGPLLLTACNPPTNVNVSFGCSTVVVSYTAQGGQDPKNPSDYEIDVVNSSNKRIGTANGLVDPAGTTYTVNVGIPTQPLGTPLKVLFFYTPSNALTFTGKCGNIATYFNPGDGRAAPLAADRIVPYCLQATGMLNVWGVKPDSTGFLLTTFSYKDIVAAGIKGVYHNLGINGVVSVVVDSQNNFWLAWNGGQYNADGQPKEGFAKGFNCTF